MILYFANRKMKILGHASTNLPQGYVITSDNKTEEIDTGVAVFTCTFDFTAKTRKEIEAMTDAGNYLLRSDGADNEFYTIIDTEIDSKKQEVYIYAEDAGLDLINEIVGEFAATAAQPAEWYINQFVNGSGWEIGINEIPATSTRKLAWEGESTVTERLASIATQFGGFEVSYTFAVEGMEVAHKYINIFAERGKEINEQLRLNREIDRIITKKSVANLATALKVTGGTPSGKNKPITLKGYKYDDGDFYVDGEYLKSREALKKWGRIHMKNATFEGHIEKQYSYDTTSQSELCNRAISELKRACEPEVNYEIDINYLPANVKIGDRINIVDDAGELYLSARILILEKSVIDNKHTATLGEYLQRSSGIADKINDLADKVTQMEQGGQVILTLDEYTELVEAGLIEEDILYIIIEKEE